MTSSITWTRIGIFTSIAVAIVTPFVTYSLGEANVRDIMIKKAATDIINIVEAETFLESKSSEMQSQLASEGHSGQAFKDKLTEWEQEYWLNMCSEDSAYCKKLESRDERSTRRQRMFNVQDAAIKNAYTNGTRANNY